MNGESISWFNNGQIFFDRTYKNGVLLKGITYNQNGEIIIVNNYSINNEKNGLNQSQNRNIESSYWKMGVRNGDYKLFYKSG